MININNVNKTLFFILIAILFLIFNFDAFFSFFSQDDFFHLNQVLSKSLFDLPALMLPINELGRTFYRPLSREFYNFFMLNIFGLNSLPYHLVNLLLMLINLILIRKIWSLFSKNKILLLLTMIFYLFSSVHNVELYYLSSIQTLLATLFGLLTIINIKLYSEKTERKYLLGVYIFFAAALFCHESSIMLVPMAAILEFLSFKNFSVVERVKKTILTLLPCGMIIVLRVLIFLTLIGLPKQSIYQPVFSLKTMINSFGWFTAWCFGLPEILVDFIGPGLHLNSNFIKWYGYYVIIAFPLFTLLIITCLLVILFSFKKLIKDWQFLLYGSFFILSLFPFLFFPNHKFIYYLSFPIVWFSFMMGYLISKFWDIKKVGKLILAFTTCSYVVINYQTSNLNRVTYWAAKRAVAAKYILNEVSNLYPKVDRNTVFYIEDDPGYPNIAKDWGTSSKQAFYILSGADAFRLLYHDQSIKVLYQSNDILPTNTNSSKIISYMPHFPY